MVISIYMTTTILENTNELQKKRIATFFTQSNYFSLPFLEDDFFQTRNRYRFIPDRGGGKVFNNVSFCKLRSWNPEIVGHNAGALTLMNLLEFLY